MNPKHNLEHLSDAEFDALLHAHTVVEIEHVVAHVCAWCGKKGYPVRNGNVSLNDIEFFMFHLIDKDGHLVHCDGFMASPSIPS